MISAGLGQTHVARRACRRIWQRTRKAQRSLLGRDNAWQTHAAGRHGGEPYAAVCSGMVTSLCEPDGQMGIPARQDSDSDSLLTPAVGNLGNQSMKAQQGLNWATRESSYLWFSDFRSQKIHHSRFTIIRQATSNQLIIRVWSGDGWVNWLLGWLAAWQN